MSLASSLHKHRLVRSALAHLAAVKLNDSSYDRNETIAAIGEIFAAEPAAAAALNEPALFDCLLSERVLSLTEESLDEGESFNGETEEVLKAELAKADRTLIFDALDYLADLGEYYGAAVCEVLRVFLRAARDKKVRVIVARGDDGFVGGIYSDAPLNPSLADGAANDSAARQALSALHSEMGNLPFAVDLNP